MEKTKVQQVLDSEPENLDIDAFTERLYLLQKIEKAEAELAAGKGIPHEEVKQRLAKWRK
jgi:hypothetical protein